MFRVISMFRFVWTNGILCVLMISICIFDRRLLIVVYVAILILFSDLPLLNLLMRVCYNLV